MNKFAVFDIDGTLIRWQLYHVMVDKLAKQELLGVDATEQLHQARMKWKRREHPEAFASYEQALIAIFEASMPTLKTHDFDALVDEVIDTYKDQVYTYTRDLIKHLKQQGYTLLAISGSHQELVARLAMYYGFDDWVGSVYERRDGGYTGQKFVGSHDKQAVLDQLIDKHHLDLQDSYAVGDSKSDAAMLQMVTHPIAFNPDRSLFDLARKNHWNIVIERKNMTYPLEWRDGNYVLAETGE
jgi:HAD superfamily hydrolase (TIGR01490 family)